MKKNIKYIIILFIQLLIACNGNRESKTDPNTTNTKQVQPTNIEKPKMEEWSCNICKQKFSGRGYELTYDGACKEIDKGTQGFLCSCACANKARQDLNTAVDDAIKYGKNH